ncbi:MAG: DUF5009 domain-containing protein [Paludibacter sp.]
MSPSTKSIPSRLLSLDVMRGITIAGMILVNNPGSWGSIYAPLRHAAWNGLTPTDLVFPFFMFIMGVSMFLSYKKFDFKFTKQTFIKLLRRLVLLFIIGLFLNWFSLFAHGMSVLRTENLPLIDKIWQSATDFQNLRILGILQRLALVSFFGSLIVLIFKHKRIPGIIGFILILYWILLGATDSYGLTESSIVTMIDRAVLGANHLYTEHLADGTAIRFDPEGVVSTLPGIAHVLIGFMAGKLISETKENHQRIEKLFILGSVILFLGFLFDYGFPINKALWSSSYVLVTCGLASLLLALLIWLIDIKGHKKWSVFFESFGVNPMFIYVVASIFGTTLINTGFMHLDKWTTVKGYIFNEWLLPLFGDYFGSLVYALMFVGVSWLIGSMLYKRKIFIKL